MKKWSKEVGKEEKTSSRSKISASFKVGAIALAFLIIGYQAALFVRSAAVARLESHRDAPDTVFVIDESLARRLFSISPSEDPSSVPSDLSRPSHRPDSPLSGPGGSPSSSSALSSGNRIIIRRNADHSPASNALLSTARGKRIETFTFDPNTISLNDLQRLGFTQRQAQSIINYREKGGRFRRPSDFAKSYVVADSVYRRLAPYIRIPRIDINTADSVSLVTLPGIGPYYAVEIIKYRDRLRGYSYPEQLMDIYRFDQDRFDALKDLITVSSPTPYPLWTLPESELSQHPYISTASAHGIVLYRDNNPRDRWTVSGLRAAGVLRPADADRLARCLLASP